MERNLKVSLIDANPDQPRKRFPEDHIEALAKSIAERGQLQAIKVRPKKGGRFEIVLGECRWRAIKHLKRETIRADVEDMSDKDVKLCAIVENLQRRDMNPMEEANAFADLQRDGYSLDDIARELGLAGPKGVQNKLELLKLDEQIQKLVASNQLPAYVGIAIAMVPRREQSALVRDYIAGKLKTVEQVRHAAIAVKEANAQLFAFGRQEAPRATKKDVETLEKLEGKIVSVRQMIAAGFKDGECQAARRVSPDRVSKMADELALVRKHVLQMEQQLRNAAAQQRMTLEVIERKVA